MLATATHPPDSKNSIFSLSDEILSCSGNGTAATEAGVLLMTVKEIDRRLNGIEDRLVDEPANVCKDNLYFQIKQLLIGFSELNTEKKLKLIGLLQSSFSKFVQSLRADLATGSFQASQWRQACEIYAVTIWNAVVAAETAAGTEKSANAAKSKVKGAVFEWSQARLLVLEKLRLFASLPLTRVFDAAAERESVVSCIVKAAHRIMETAENMKSTACKKLALEVLTECARTQNYCTGLQTIITQDLIYFEHLAEPLAELFQLLYATNGSNCEMICEDLLKSLGAYRFNSQDSTASTRIAAVFLAKLAAICPREALRSLSLFIDQIDSEAYSIRMAMVEVLGSLIYHLMSQEDRSDHTKSQTKSLFAALEERFRDINSFVRTKTIQVCCDLAKSSSIPINERPKLLQLAADRVMDKSSNVRRKAIQLLGDFLRTHPFCVDGGELNLKFFQGRLDDINRFLNELAPPEAKERTPKDEDAMDVFDDEGDTPDPTDDGTNVNPAQIGSLLVQKQYYTDAIKFVTLINSVIPTICLLLSSTTKSEVIEVMEFLVDAHIYKLEKSKEGIRKMLHLIWEKELSSEDGTKMSIKEQLVQNYRKIYLFADDSLGAKERSQTIAQNLIGLVDGITVAEMASLSELFGVFMNKNLIGESVIQQVFAVFASNEFDRRHRRSAIIILAMLSKSRRDIVEKRLEAVIKLGLGTLGLQDCLVAQYALEAIQSLAGSAQQSVNLRLPHDNILFERIAAFVLGDGCRGPRWFPVVAAAINAIFMLADKPSAVVSGILSALAKDVFSGEAQAQGLLNCSRNKLCKLLLVIGQVASCTSNHLDLVERHGKDTAQKMDAKSAKGADADLAKVSASAEDDFAELVKGVREQEVLYGPQSLLGVLAPLVAHICSNNVAFHERALQRIATVALARLMTVSSRFCEQHLRLYLAVLEHAEDAVVRSNMAIAFGDLAQGFNRVMDENIDALFRRLGDGDLRVRRNTLMVLTHLALTGMIKVKGQIGDMARCLIDRDERIRNLARVFFSEMAARDAGGVGSNGIYNHIPDILSHLSAGGAAVPEEDFHAIMRFIFDFIRKERQMENLIEKLCLRFRQSDSARHARDLAFCLGLVNFAGDRALRKLVEGFPQYQDKLVDERVMQAFVEIVNRSRKSCKAELRPVLNDFEQRLLQAANGNLERADAPMTSFAALSQSVSRRRAAGPGRGRGRRAGAGAGRRPRSHVACESDESDGAVSYGSSGEEEDAPAVKAGGAPSRQHRAVPRRRAAARLPDYAEEEEGEEGFVGGGGGAGVDDDDVF